MTEPNVIDKGALDELQETTGGDPEFLAELIETYLDDAPGLLATMRWAIGAANAEELRRAAHSLKSNSASFGARMLATRCQELEQRAKNGIFDGASERLVHVETAYADAERALRALLPQA